MSFLIISIISSFISANKIEKSGDFVKSDEILRDVLFGGRKSNIDFIFREENTFEIWRERLMTANVRELLLNAMKR